MENDLDVLCILVIRLSVSAIIGLFLFCVYAGYRRSRGLSIFPKKKKAELVVVPMGQEEMRKRRMERNGMGGDEKPKTDLKVWDQAEEKKDEVEQSASA